MLAIAQTIDISRKEVVLLALVGVKTILILKLYKKAINHLWFGL